MDIKRCGGMAKEKLSLQQQANQILIDAQKKGVSTNFFFVTTFKRYQVQMKIMSELENEINEIGATVKKEYVKGRMNVYTNPAITEYNKTATAANGTVSTLINILKSFTDDASGPSKLQEMMSQLSAIDGE